MLHIHPFTHTHIHTPSAERWQPRRAPTCSPGAIRVRCLAQGHYDRFFSPGGAGLEPPTFRLRGEDSGPPEPLPSPEIEGQSHRERGTERQRERQRQREPQRATERDRQTEGATEPQSHRERDRETESQRERVRAGRGGCRRLHRPVRRCGGALVEVAAGRLPVLVL